jgi:hypothetical protein
MKMMILGYVLIHNSSSFHTFEDKALYVIFYKNMFFVILCK